jgi:hypothetical protein
MNTETIEYTETVEERPVHMARCADCDHAVRFRPNSSGTGFFLVGTEELYGVGALGRPVCPNGHGEMELADDRLPIEQAMEQANEQLDAVQRDLPGIVPPFNWQGAYLELESMSLEVDRLHRIWEDDAKQAKESKGQWEEASKRRDKAALEFRRRRLAKGEDTPAAAPPAAGTNLVRCAFEEAHPDATCPICSDPDLTATMARDSAAHIDEVWALLELRDVTAVEVALEEAGVIIGQAAIRSWSRSDRDTVTAWAANRELPRPGILGTAHVAADSVTSEADGDTFQECRECGQRIWSVKTGEDPEARLAEAQGYPAGTLVGTDCAGAKEPARRIPRRGKKATK